jgi:glycosyltransferase involved in cell wall biosynthesis
MNIAMLIPGITAPAAPGTYRDAWEIQTRQLAMALSGLGHRVDIFTRRCARDTLGKVQLSPMLTLSHLPAGPPMALDGVQVRPHLGEFAAMLADTWQREPPDVVHAHSWLYGLTALLAGREHRGLPVVQTFHRLAPRSAGTNMHSRNGLRVRFACTVGGWADAVIANNATELSDLVRLGLARRRISVIPYGVDTRGMSPDGPCQERAMPYRIVVLDELSAQHGVDDVVAALAAVPDTELVVAGGPSAADLGRDQDALRIRALADRLGVADRVSLLGGIPPERVPPLLRSADLAVSVPWAHATGKPALDAMACGVPVVCTGVGGLADAVVDGVTGLHVRAGRPGQLAKELRILLQAPVRRRALALAGRDRILARYNWERIAAETVRLYSQLPR